MPSEARVHDTYIVNINPCHHDRANDSFDSIRSYSPVEDFEDQHDSSDYAQDEADVPDVQSHDQEPTDDQEPDVQSHDDQDQEMSKAFFLKRHNGVTRRL